MTDGGSPVSSPTSQATHLTTPPESIVNLAIAIARITYPGRCVKSRRGAVAFGVQTRRIYGSGYNFPAAPDTCSGSDACRSTCRQRCVHAEQIALLNAMTEVTIRPPVAEPIQLVHVKVSGPDLALVGGGPPTCVQCSKLLAASTIIAGVWLYEATPEAWCPHVDLPATECAYCQGEGCRAPHGAGGAPGACDHDVLDRHCDLPVVDARWRYYPVQEFHRRSLAAVGSRP